MKFKIGNRVISVEQVEPDAGETYHHKQRDPKDLIQHVVVTSVEDSVVYYTKYYKDNTRPAEDSAPVSEFNHWFRKGE